MIKLLLASLVFAVPIAFGLYLVLKPAWLRRRRANLFAQPLPAGIETLLQKNVGLYSRLPEALQRQLQGHMNVFLAEKRFLGMDGQVIDDEVVVTIAANACLLLLNRDVTYFPGFSSILVYPSVYQADHVEYDDGIVSTRKSHRAGESWHRGPIVLAWDSVREGAANAHDGYNVVLHEFAHKLDEENNGTNGQPVLYVEGHYSEWAPVLADEYKAFADRVARRKNRVMDEYGLTSPAEFFAVATESFFEKGASMQRRLPELYEQLQKFYAVDPAEWP